MPRSGQVVQIVADAAHVIQAFGRAVVQFFTISASAQDGATISPSGDVSAEAGSTVEFTVGAEPGFEIASILVDGVEVLVP